MFSVMQIYCCIYIAMYIYLCNIDSYRKNKFPNAKLEKFDQKCIKTVDMGRIKI